jgi:hypothetical protein
MIEITTYPDIKTIYIDFSYKGIPENLPIEKIIIREKPASIKGSLLLLREMLEEGEIFEEEEEEKASMQFNESNEMIIHIPENAVPDENIRDTLQELYIDANSIVFGERLEEIEQMVEIPEGEKRYSIDIQVSDMMDELLSTIPNSQRTKNVLDNIHLLIDRFKELRIEFSKFDTNQNVYDAKMNGAYYKPLIEHLKKIDTNLRWLIPVVKNRKKLYLTKEMPSENDIIAEHTTDTTFNDISIMQKDYYNNSNNQLLQYRNFENYTQEWLKPFDKPLYDNDCLTTINVMTSLDTVVDNFEDFYSSV